MACPLGKVALVPALCVAVLTVRDPGILNSVNEQLNVLQSVLLPFAMLPVLHFSVSKRLLNRFVPNGVLMAISWAMALLVIGVVGRAVRVGRRARARAARLEGELGGVDAVLLQVV